MNGSHVAMKTREITGGGLFPILNFKPLITLTSDFVNRLVVIKVLRVLLVAIGLLGWPTAIQAAETEPLRVAIGQDFAPFEYIDDSGNAVGLIAELWRLWSKKTETPILFKPAPWKKSLEMVRNGGADIHAGLNYTKERVIFLDYGDKILTTNSYVFSPKEFAFSGSAEHLVGFRVGVLRGSLEESILRKNKADRHLIAFDHIDELYKAVSDNRIRIFSDVEQTALFYMNKHGLMDKFRFDASMPLETNYLFSAVAKGRHDLLAKVNTGLRLITPRERSRIIRQWLKPKGVNRVNTVVIAIARDFAPFTLIDAEGQAAGLLVDLWREWARQTGRQIEFQQSDWANTLTNLGNGDADVHSGLPDDPAFSDWIARSAPIYQTELSFFGPAGGEAPTRGATAIVGAVAGSQAESHLGANGADGNLVLFRDHAAMVKALAAGRIDHLLAEDRVIEAILSRTGLRGRIAKNGPTVRRQDIVAGVRKGEPKLLALIDNGFDAIPHKRLVELERRWIGRGQHRFFTTSPVPLTAAERTWLATHRTVRVHNEMDWPPFNFSEDGEPRGFSIDFMKRLAERIGLEVTFVTGPSWNDFLGMMKSGDLDIMLNIVKTPDRQAYLRYTRPYIDNPNSILSHKNTPYHDLESLNGKTISVPKGFFYEEILRRDFPDIKLHLVRNTLDSMKAVTFGKADAALGELAVFNYLMGAHFMTDLVLSGEVKLGSPEYALLNIATRSDSPLLASILDKGVRSMDQTELRALKQKWFSDVSNAGERLPVLNLTEEERAWLETHPEIRLGVDPTYPPFDFLDPEGAHVGIAADFMDLVRKRLGIRTRVVPGLSWTQVLEGVKNGAVDVLPAVSSTDSRRRYLNFTQVHMDYPRAILVRDDFPFITGLSDLKGRRIATVNGYAVTGFLARKHPFIETVEFKTPVQALEAVANGRSDAMLLNLAVATHLIRKNRLNNLKIAAKAEIDLPGLAIGVRKDWPELVPILNKALQSITTEESVRIFDRWIAVRFDIATDDETLIKVSLAVGGAMALLFFLYLGLSRYRNRQREVRIREREAAAHMRSEFVAIVSHEVRTPMNGVLGMARLLLDTPLSDRQKEFAQTIVESGQSLLTILNDLLDISKLDSGKLELETLPFSPHAVVRDAIRIMAPHARERGLALDHGIADTVPETLLGDANRVRQILFNLLSNAIKFTREGSVSIRLSGTPKAGTPKDGSDVMLSMKVRDTGIGISKEAVARLFSPYYQASAGVAREYGGTGLGLSICQHLARLMGGTIEIESEVAVGSTFTFRALFPVPATPVAHEPTMAAAGPSVRRSTSVSHRILIVEDNRINRKVIEALVDNLGHRATVVENGAEAVAMLQNNTAFDVVLMDRHMPVMDGIEATQQIRRLPGPIADIPIIGLTAAVTPREIESCLGAGMSQVVAKPIDPAELILSLEAVDSREGPSVRVVDSETDPDPADRPPVLDPIANEKLRQEFGDDMFVELAEDFREVGQESLDGIDAAMIDSDVDRLIRHAHNLKTNAATFGLTRLSLCARDIEQMGKQDHLENLRNLHAGLAAIYDEALLALSEIMPPERNQPEKPGE